MLKLTLECAGSMVNASRAARLGGARVSSATAPSAQTAANRFMVGPYSVDEMDRAAPRLATRFGARPRGGREEAGAAPEQAMPSGETRAYGWTRDSPRRRGE